MANLFMLCVCLCVVVCTVCLHKCVIRVWGGFKSLPPASIIFPRLSPSQAIIDTLLFSLCSVFHFVCVPRRVHGPSPEAASIGADFCIVPDVGTYGRCELRVLDPSSECRKAYTHSNSTVHMFSA